MDSHCSGSIAERVDEHVFNPLERGQHLIDMARSEGAEATTRRGPQCAVCSAWRFPCPACAVRATTSAVPLPAVASIAERRKPIERLALREWAARYASRHPVQPSL